MHIAPYVKRTIKEIEVKLDNTLAALEEVSHDLRHEDIWQDEFHDTHDVLVEEIESDLVCEIQNIIDQLKKWRGEEI